MLKVLIAEDDKLVRKGLIALMPWEQFGLQIAGEAVNGEAALQFLENHEVDLLITDLAMPVMSGIELMRAVRMRWPHIWLVVLTFHQDFEYVQEALRLGAIDYIVKTQLDKESMEDVLSRIVGRIREEAGKPLRAGRLLAAGKDQLQFQSHYGYALILPREDHEPPMSGADRRLSEDWLEIEQGLWLNIRDEAAEIPDDGGLHERFGVGGETVILKLSDLAGMNKLSVVNWLRDYRERGFFYEAKPGRRLYEISVLSEQQKHPIVFEEEVLKLGDQWSSLVWVNNDQLFHEWLAGLKSVRLPRTKLETVFFSAIREWKRKLNLDSLGAGEEIGRFNYWHEWEDWLKLIQRTLKQATNKSAYSQPVLESILKAAELVLADLSRPVNLVDMAEQVHMSRSYFSQCFKDIMGKPFNEYVRDKRMEKAKELLVSTQLPILQIAENVGYPNEKYFSRLFRELEGVTPSEYRVRHFQGA